MAVVGWRSGPVWRRLSSILAILLTVAMAGLLVNGHYQYYPTVASLLGQEARFQTGLDQLDGLRDAARASGRLPANGVTVEVAIPGTESGFDGPRRLRLPPTGLVRRPSAGAAGAGPGARRAEPDLGLDAGRRRRRHRRRLRRGQRREGADPRHDRHQRLDRRRHRVRGRALGQRRDLRGEGRAGLPPQPVRGVERGRVAGHRRALGRRDVRAARLAAQPHGVPHLRRLLRLPVTRSSTTPPTPSRTCSAGAPRPSRPTTRPP